jgi:hypothetical protein
MDENVKNELKTVKREISGLAQLLTSMKNGDEPNLQLLFGILLILLIYSIILCHLFFCLINVL